MSERADTAYSPRFREEGLVGCCGNELAAQPANFFTLQLEGFSISRYWVYNFDGYRELTQNLTSRSTGHEKNDIGVADCCNISHFGG